MRTVLGLCALLGVWLSGPVAKAQVDVERFKPAVTHDGWVTAEGSDNRYPDDPWELGLFANYALNPLVTADEDGDLRDQIVRGRLGLDLIASLTLADPVSIGVDLPVYLLQSGAADPSFAGLGDVRVVPKLRILRDRDAPL
jgi:OOP family OmpA-OmpF porin